MTIKDSKHVKINRVNPLYIIINKVNGYFEEINKVKYLTLVPTNKSKEKKYTKLWCNIIDLIRTVTKKSYDYDETYIKKSKLLHITLTKTNTYVNIYMGKLNGCMF